MGTLCAMLLDSQPTPDSPVGATAIALEGTSEPFADGQLTLAPAG
jgi:hypothetical protein